MLEAKKYGHTVYNIVRRKEFVCNVCEMVSNDKNDVLFKEKICKIIKQHDIDKLRNEINYNCFRLLTLLYDGTPILYFCGLNNWIKGFDLILSKIIHISNVYSINNQFGKQYINYPSAKHRSNVVKFC